MMLVLVAKDETSDRCQQTGCGANTCLSGNSGNNKNHTNSNIGDVLKCSSFSTCNDGRGKDGSIQTGKFTEIEDFS